MFGFYSTDKKKLQKNMFAYIIILNLYIYYKPVNRCECTNILLVVMMVTTFRA